MSGRIEYKYLAPTALLDTIRAELLPFVQTDPFAARKGLHEYTVRSVYYDTPRSSCYYEKLDGVECRRKFRIRGYNQPDQNSVVFLEIKRKHGSLISKNRAPLLRASLDPFMAAPDVDGDLVLTGREPRAREDARRFLYYYYRLRLRPAVLVVYDREPFACKFDPSLRLTFDKRLRGELSPALSDLYRDRGLQLAMPGFFIFEVKFFRGALPAWVSNIIKRHGLRRMALSKFTICLDAGRTKWGTAQVRKRIAPAGLA